MWLFINVSTDISDCHTYVCKVIPHNGIYLSQYEHGTFITHSYVNLLELPDKNEIEYRLS